MTASASPAVGRARHAAGQVLTSYIGAAIPVIGTVLYWFVPTGPITAVDLVQADATSRILKE